MSRARLQPAGVAEGRSRARPMRSQKPRACQRKIGGPRKAPARRLRTCRLVCLSGAAKLATPDVAAGHPNNNEREQYQVRAYRVLSKKS